MGAKRKSIVERLAEATDHVERAVKAATERAESLQKALDGERRRANDAETERQLVEQRLAEAQRLLSESAPAADASNAVRLQFSFPAPVRSACEQYLMYFGEFLRDLGVDSSTTLREDAGKVLFQVIPSDPTTALEQIKEALDIFLGLPASQLDDNGSDDLAVHKLSAMIYHLKSQLTLAAAVVQAQHASIEAQAITIETQRNVLAGRIGAAISTDSEPIFGGVVDVMPLDGKGFRLNLPKLFRDLKNRFRS